MKKEEKGLEVNILGRSYPLRGTEQDLGILETIEETLNHQLKQYKLTYEQLDNQDCLSMALIENHFASAQKEIVKKDKDYAEVEKKLLSIDQYLSDLLAMS